MTTGEKIAALRKKIGMTQEQLADILSVSRQSVSRWEMDAAFPETEKLIKLSNILACSIDYLLNNDLQKNHETGSDSSAQTAYQFIRECGYFFLATSVDNRPKLRPMGMIYSNDQALFIATDKRKNVYADLIGNPQVQVASYNLNSRRWIRISGKTEIENSIQIRHEMTDLYPMIKQEFIDQDEIHIVIFKLKIEDIHID